MKTGVQNYLKRLDSRFRGNDGKEKIRAFYEIIMFDCPVRRITNAQILNKGMPVNHNHNPPGPALNQDIFRLGLSVETISVYLLCCSFSDDGAAISTRNLLGVWNGTREALFDGIKELEKRNILLKIISGGEDKNVYKLTENKSWKL